MLEETWQPEDSAPIDASTEDPVCGLATALSEPDEFLQNATVLYPSSPLLEPHEHEHLSNSRHARASEGEVHSDDILEPLQELDHLPEPPQAEIPSAEVHSDDILEPDDNQHACEFTDGQENASDYGDIDFDLDDLPDNSAQQVDFDEDLHAEQASHILISEHQNDEGQQWASLSMESERFHEEQVSTAMSPAHDQLEMANATLFETHSQYSQGILLSSDLPDGSEDRDMEFDQPVSQDMEDIFV